MRYYYLCRPPGIGCQPERYLRFEAIYPARPLGQGDLRNVHGFVDYARPLDHQYVWRYDLVPADPVERARYRIARIFVDFGRGEAEDQQHVDEVIDQTIQVYRERLGEDVMRELKDFEGDEVLRAACMVVKEEGKRVAGSSDG